MNAATTSLQPWLDRLREGWNSSPLPTFFAWWGKELGALLPARWRTLLGGGADWYLLQARGGEWSLRHAGEAEPLARWRDSLAADAQQAALAAAWRQAEPEDRRLALLLPSAAVLRRPLHLPQAARGKLRQVAGYELDRQTPFTAAQVYYAVRELPGAAPAGRVATELLVIRRGTLDPLLKRLDTLGIAVDAVDVLAGDGRLGVDFLPPERAPHRRRPRLRLNLALGIAGLLLLLLAMGNWLHNREAALSQMQTQVDAMRSDAQQVASLRRQLQDEAGAAGFLAQRKAQRAGVLAVLLDLTQRLPATAWLERFTIDDTGQIGFQGQSPQAAKLLDLLKGSPLVDNANFQGSIQADPASGKERFYMVAQVHQAAAGKPAKAPAADGDAP